MLGPGEYVPDVTEGITSVEDLPKPRLERRRRNYRARRCPRCGFRAGRYAVATRTLHDLGDGLVHAGFADPVMEMEIITLEYQSVEAVARDLKAIGAHNSLPGRPRVRGERRSGSGRPAR